MQSRAVIPLKIKGKQVRKRDQVSPTNGPRPGSDPPATHIQQGQNSSDPNSNPFSPLGPLVIHGLHHPNWRSVTPFPGSFSTCNHHPNSRERSLEIVKMQGYRGGGFFTWNTSLFFFLIYTTSLSLGWICFHPPVLQKHLTMGRYYNIAQVKEKKQLQYSAFVRNPLH